MTDSEQNSSTNPDLSPLAIVGVPMDLGQARRGVDMGPSAVRYAGLAQRLEGLGYTVEEAGDITVPVRDTLSPAGGVDYLPEVVRVCEAVFERARELMGKDHLPIFLGGDHSIALGTIAGATSMSNCGVLWIDAHGDFNTPETSPSGNVHGMPLAALCGLGDDTMVNLGTIGAKLSPDQVVAIGIRDLDRAERAALVEHGMTLYTMRDIDEKGIARVTHDALDQLGKYERLHVSLDMDSLDPTEAPGVGTPVDGGLSYREAHLLMEIVSEDGRLGSADVVEVNPILDNRNETARLAVELVASLMGNSIL